MSSVTTDPARLDLLAVNTIRTLSMDAVQAASSGHPGTPMALAPVVYALWQRTLRFDPAKEQVIDDEEAERLLRGSYRVPYVVPEEI